MSINRSKSLQPRAEKWYRGRAVPRSAIRRFAREVAERFHPEKIILFGSHAYGKPHRDSDVDILVVMPCRNQIDQAFKIRLAVTAPFSMDLIVRKPSELEWRLKEGDSFHTEITTKGRVLYEEDNAGVVRKAESDYQLAIDAAGADRPYHDQVCFHCQQSAEKYLKSLVEELGRVIEKTHDLEKLMNDLLPHHPEVRKLRRGVVFLTEFSVSVRYPGDNATKRQAKAAIRWAGEVRDTCRAVLGVRATRKRR
jgi:HEPN domain-containing protein/predicted nucleotidyltransferase